MILHGFSYDHFLFDHVLGLFSIFLLILDLFFDVSFQVMFFKDDHDFVLPCSEILCSFKIFIKLGFFCHLLGMKTSNGNIGSSIYQFEGCFQNLLQDDLDFHGETLIFQLSTILGMNGGKWVPPQGDIDCILHFLNMEIEP